MSAQANSDRRVKVRCRTWHRRQLGVVFERSKFKCRWCKRWICGFCEGTHDAKDPIGNGLCDSCWARRERRRMKRASAASRAVRKP